MPTIQSLNKKEQFLKDNFMNMIIEEHATDKEAVVATAWVLNKLKKSQPPLPNGRGLK